MAKVKILLRCIVVVLILVAIVVAIFASSPKPASMVVRKLFEGGIAVKPDNYETILAGVDVQKNLSYTSQYAMNQFDVFRSKKATGQEPVILWVHGGAFVGGDKRDVDAYAVQIAERGFSVVSMNYALAPEAKYPTPVKQMGEMMSYLKTHQKDLNLNLDTLILAGDSAGAHIASQFAMIQNDPSYANLTGFEPVLEAGSIDAMLLFSAPFAIEGLRAFGNVFPGLRFFVDRLAWGYLGERDWQSVSFLDSLSLIKHVNQDFPTTFITDGTTWSFTDDGKAFSAKLQSMGVLVTPVFYDETVTKLQHEYQFKMNLPESVETFEALIQFLKRI